MKYIFFFKLKSPLFQYNNPEIKPKWGSTLKQKQTQLLLYPQYVLSKGKKSTKNPIRGKFQPIHYFSHVNRVKILTFRYHHENY